MRNLSKLIICLKLKLILFLFQKESLHFRGETTRQIAEGRFELRIRNDQFPNHSGNEGYFQTPKNWMFQNCIILKIIFKNVSEVGVC